MSDTPPAHVTRRAAGIAERVMLEGVVAFHQHQSPQHPGRLTNGREPPADLVINLVLEVCGHPFPPPAEFVFAGQVSRAFFVFDLLVAFTLGGGLRLVAFAFGFAESLVELERAAAQIRPAGFRQFRRQPAESVSDEFRVMRPQKLRHNRLVAFGDARRPRGFPFVAESNHLSHNLRGFEGAG